ncbi:MAG TPA: hypothetical protein VFO58_23470 [Vicinamibacterales bacterium]|nr:hypothetical protein [Vicinamibacterales bacterium]
MARLTSHTDLTDATREEILDALLHSDRAQHDELGRTWDVQGSHEPGSEEWSPSSPREQAAAPIDLHNVDE